MWMSGLVADLTIVVFGIWRTAATIEDNDNVCTNNWKG
jgi:hypothetical protein